MLRSCSLTWSWSCVLVATAAGCGDGTKDASAPTYHRDIAPLFARHCVGCHRDGHIAPFALDSYEGAKQMAAAARRAVEERTMPPFSVDASGSCNTYQNARRLTEDEIALVAAWHEAGMPAGDPVAAPRVPPPDDTILAGDVIEIDIGADYWPTPSESDEYRCFSAPLGVAEDGFITGYEVVPGNREVVHHVLVWTYDPEQLSIFEGKKNGDLVAELEGADDAPGWDCLGVAGNVQASGLPAVWTPGTGVTEFPAGTGLPVAPGQRVLFETHYYVPPGRSVESDRTQVRFRVDSHVDRPADLVLADGILDTFFEGSPFVIPPATASTVFTWEGDYRYMLTPPGPPLPEDTPLPDSVEVYGVFPHMHLAGRSLSAELHRADGSSQCVTEVPRWDFNWQEVFFYERPLRLAPGDTMEVTCTYDTRGRAGPTLPGFGSEDEMCSLGIFIAFDPPQEKGTP